MKDKNSSPSPPGEPIVLRINLHIHDRSGKFDRSPRANARSSEPRVVNPSRRPSSAPFSRPRLEGALDRNRLAELIEAGSPSKTTATPEPDIEVTLVVCL